MSNIKLPPVNMIQCKIQKNKIKPRFTKHVQVPLEDNLQAFFLNLPSIGDILVKNREKKKRKLIGQVPITITEEKYVIWHN